MGAMQQPAETDKAVRSPHRDRRDSVVIQAVRAGGTESEELLARAFDRIAKNPARWALYSVAAGVIVGGTVFSIAEEKTSIPDGMWWAFVSMSTVGYGDISPKTPAGQALAAMVMIVGYGIIAVPTGIVTAELAYGRADTPVSTQHCPVCGTGGHEYDATFCKRCGGRL